MLWEHGLKRKVPYPSSTYQESLNPFISTVSIIH